MVKKIIIVVLIIGLAGFIYFRYGFVFREGSNEGFINYLQKEGIIFKTYEGKMIQVGYNSNAKSRGGGVQSNEFKFSIRNKRLYEELEQRKGSNVKLYYTYYFGTLPWRGNSNYIVDSFVILDKNESIQRDDVLMLPDDVY